MKRGCRFSFHVCVIVAAIVYIYFSTVFIFIDQWFGLRSSPGLLNAAVFTCLALMCVYTYALAIFTDPGRIPASYVPDVEDAETTMHEIKRKGTKLSSTYPVVYVCVTSQFFYCLYCSAKI